MTWLEQRMITNMVLRTHPLAKMILNELEKTNQHICL